MANVKIYQIFYNEETQQQIDPHFIPLDNRPEVGGEAQWYEFGAIRNFLNTHQLDDDTFYGFVSPKISKKVGLTSEQLIKLIQRASDADVCFPAYPYYALSYYINPFEHGEEFHPNITELTQQLIDQLDWQLDLSKLVCATTNFNYSNFIFAKKKYWQTWLHYAQQLYDLVEHDQSELGKKLRGDTFYNLEDRSDLTPMRAFIQERLPAIIFAQHSFRIAHAENDKTFPVLALTHQQPQNAYDYAKFHMCNYLKIQYLQTGDSSFLETYWHIRSLIALTPK